MNNAGLTSPAPLAGLVRAHRGAAGLTQRELARRSGISLRTLQDIEQGRTAAPRPASVDALATALELAGPRRAQLAAAARPAGRGHGRGGLRLLALGPLEAWRDGTPVALGPVRQRALLGLLALHAGPGIRRAAIIDAVWGEEPPPTAVAMVQLYVSRSRRLLGDGGLITWDGAAYRLEAGRAGLDVTEFGDLAGRGRRAVAGGDPAAGCDLYDQALSLWRGDALSGIEVLSGHPAVIQLGQQRAAVVLEFAAAAAAAGQAGRSVAHLERLAGREPLDERVHARLMAVLAATGRQAAALRLYQDLAQRLASELGVSPGAEIADTYLRILRREITPAPAVPAAAAAAPGRPAATDPAVPRQVPARSRHFAGRAAELAALLRLAGQAAATSAGTTAGTAVIAAVSGPAGVGKSALAVQFGHRAAGRFPDGQLYVNLRGFDPGGTPVTPAEALRGFLDALQVPAAQVPAGPDAQAARYRSLLAGRRMLIILDNARDADQVRPLLPGGSGCMTLVTSRSQLASLAVAHDAHPLTLDVLTDEQARELLARRLGAERVSAEPGAVQELTGFCARLPLALAIVAVHAAARPARTLAALADDLRDERSRLDALDAGDPAVSPRTVFSWSQHSLSGPARRMFRLLGLHPGPDITPAAAASLAGISPGPARAALRELTRAHLLAEPVPGRFSSHDLLRLYAAESARGHGGEPARQAARRRLLDHYLHTARAAGRELFPDYDLLPVAAPQPGVIPEDIAGNEAAMAWFEAEQRVLVAAVALAAAAGFDSHASRIPAALTVFFERRAAWGDYLDTQRAALAAAERLADPASQARAHRALSNVSIQLGAFADAHAHLGQALRLYRQTGDTTGEGRAHESLAFSYNREGRLRESLEHSEQSLRLFQAGGQRFRQAMAWNNIGWCHAQLGHHDQAIASCRQALAIYQELGQSAEEAATWDSLGYAYLHLGDHDEAARCYETAARQFSARGDRFLLASVLLHLGAAQETAGRPEAAVAALAQGLAVLGDLEHPEAAAGRAALARLRGA
jgi:DNA-binding SARP family transcriptional activator/tetratricopeptide (TPR) repeat protein/DNA-binding XRE family transcriptional regulator